MRGDLRTVGKGLVIHRWQLRYHGQRLKRCHKQLVVLGAQVLGHSTCVGALVKTCLFKSYGKGLDSGAASQLGLLLHQRHDHA